MKNDMVIVFDFNWGSILFKTIGVCRSDLYEECSRYGSLEGKVKVFEHNPLGVVAVKFQDAACADRCLQVSFIKQQLYH